MLSTLSSLPAQARPKLAGNQLESLLVAMDRNGTLSLDESLPRRSSAAKRTNILGAWVYCVALTTAPRVVVVLRLVFYTGLTFAS